MVACGVTAQPQARHAGAVTQEITMTATWRRLQPSGWPFVQTHFSISLIENIARVQS
jgi:hypothetical protein